MSSFIFTGTNSTSRLKSPLFCVHVFGRGLKFYLPLAHHFALEQPLYGLAAQMLDKKYAPPNRVKDLAAHYIKEMRILQPDKPFFLIELLFNKGLQTARDRAMGSISQEKSI